MPRDKRRPARDGGGRRIAKVTNAPANLPDLTPMKITRPKTLTEMVVVELRKRIIDGRLQLGEALSENALAADLGISKTPVREALLQLKLEKLVDVLPQRGTYVFRMAPDQVAMISELREVLEVSAAAAAIARNHAPLVERMTHIFDDMRAAFERSDNAAYGVLDGEYHQAMIDLCGNPYITDAYAQVGFRTQALRARLSDEAGLQPHLIQGSPRDAEADQGARRCAAAEAHPHAYQPDPGDVSRCAGAAR